MRRFPCASERIPIIWMPSREYLWLFGLLLSKIYQSNHENHSSRGLGGSHTDGFWVFTNFINRGWGLYNISSEGYIFGWNISAPLSKRHISDRLESFRLKLPLPSLEEFGLYQFFIAIHMLIKFRRYVWYHLSQMRSDGQSQSLPVMLLALGKSSGLYPYFSGNNQGSLELARQIVFQYPLPVGNLSVCCGLYYRQRLCDRCWYIFSLLPNICGVLMDAVLPKLV